MKNKECHSSDMFEAFYINNKEIKDMARRDFIFNGELTEQTLAYIRTLMIKQCMEVRL